MRPRLLASELASAGNKGREPAAAVLRQIPGQGANANFPTQQNLLLHATRDTADVDQAPSPLVQAYSANMERDDPATLLVHVRKEVLCEHRPPAAVITEARARLPRQRRAAADMDTALCSGVLSDFRLLHAETLAGAAKFYKQGIHFTQYVMAALDYAGSAVAWSTAAMDLGCEEPGERDADAVAALEARYATLTALGSRLDQLAGDAVTKKKSMHVCDLVGSEADDAYNT
ncbi:hypothetical protein OEZ85_002405 [Tetradesmus obliquus]|uniref:BRO1 domain-containing protein n=1 Tax=Tetradesmus obliquus TaxID=3088 RepID=A0ABY8U328_TETOB|nr:hypothetical protein OEZ85_002405 [Tetradesmus obliquus]